nr:MAG TPA: holin [Caudoviricetes sp.]
MDIQTIISVMTIALMVIAFFIYIAWQIKKNGLKEFATQMIVKAEDMYKKGQNDEKFNYVVEKVIAMIPMPLQLFITEDMVKNFIQKVFDSVKTALDYTPKKEG